MIDHNTLVVLLGVAILGASAGMVGTFAVLRRRALTGDALSHAALPGICLAFLISGEKRLPVLLFGALLSGLLGVLVITALRRWTRLKEDAAVGIVLSVFFGAGLVLVQMIQKLVPGGSKAGLAAFILGKTAGTVEQDVYLIAAAALGCLLVVLLLYKEFKLITFDAGFARVQGWPSAWLDLLLMALLAVTVMIGLPAVGAVLMAALVIVPGATARLWTDRLGLMLLLAGAIGGVTGILGAAWSANFAKTPAGPMIILVGASFFLASLLLAPRHGLVARWLAQRTLRRDVEERKMLALLYDLAEATLPEQAIVRRDDLLTCRPWQAAATARFIDEAMQNGLLTSHGDDLALTTKGLARAATAARGQRLWNLFLREHADFAPSVVDLAEASVDRVLSPSLVAELEAMLERDGKLPYQPRTPPMGHSYPSLALQAGMDK